MTAQINASALQLPYDAVGTETNRMRQYKRSKKAKISTLAFSVYASKVMYSNNNSWHTTKAAVPLKKDYKILQYPIEIPQLFSFHKYIVV